MTLLEQAKLAATGGKPPATVTPEQVEVLLAFIRGEVTYGQLGEAICVTRSSGVAARTVSLLRRAVQLGLVKVEAST